MAAYIMPLGLRVWRSQHCICQSTVLKHCQRWIKVQNIQQLRFYHVPRNSCSRFLTGKPERRLQVASCRTTTVLRLAPVRLASSAAVTSDSKPTVLDPIPEPPVPLPEPPASIVDVAPEIAQAATTEPSFASMGLGGWSPIGIVQNSLEYLHVTWDIPWWGTIVIGTIVVRCLMFPLVILSQRNAAKMNNHMPQLQLLQLKMTEARQSGNAIEAARYAQELTLFMKEKQLNPLKNLLVPLAQAPLFISFFIALRRMANVPVESMMTGGLFWFTDLTIPDQYYLLPLITSLTLYVTIEIGTDAARLQSSNMGLMKYVLRALPVIILPFIINFPGAILCYWVSTNFISLLQVAILRVPAVRSYFKIDPLVRHDPSSLPVKPKGFVKGFKDSWQNLQITRELEERQRFDEIQFQKAGRVPIKKTYKFDPTQIIQDSQRQAVAAKKRD